MGMIYICVFGLIAWIVAVFLGIQPVLAFTIPLGVGTLAMAAKTLWNFLPTVLGRS
jgi:hypothetical protein